MPPRFCSWRSGTTSRSSRLRDGLPALEEVSLLESERTRTSLVACCALIDVSPLAGLPKLTSLQLRRCERVSDISSLTHAVSLETVNLTSSRQVTSDDVLRASGITIRR